VGYEGIRKSVLTWQGLRWGSRRWGRYPEKTYEDYRREEAEERQRKINAVLSEIREKFGEGVMRLGSDFLKNGDVENG